METPGSGCHDMAGNVWEWALAAPPEEGPILRGGCWENSTPHLRVIVRARTQADVLMDMGNLHGFRVAR